MYLLITFFLMSCNLVFADSVAKIDAKTIEITRTAPKENISFDEAYSEVNRLKQAEINALADAAARIDQANAYKARREEILNGYSTVGINWADLEALKRQPK